MRHAFLIMCHNNFEILNVLVKMLDNETNDIYIHFDKKVKDIPTIRCNHSKLYILSKRIDINWGTISQIKLEFLLFNESFKNGPYLYYHLLSGVDLPIKSNDYIQNFFIKNQGKEFVGFVDDKGVESNLYKIQYYHFFAKHFRNNNSLSRKLHDKLLFFQIKHHICRHKNESFKKGANWVSITNDFVRYLLDNEKRILSKYYFTHCADEFFIQTALWESPFRENIYNFNDEYISCQRKICWKRGNPYTWKKEDFNELINSDYIFARKFDEANIDIVKMIYNSISH